MDIVLNIVIPKKGEKYTKCIGGKEYEFELTNIRDLDFIEESSLNKSENMTRDELIEAIRAKKKSKPLGVLKYESPNEPAIPYEDWELGN